MSRIKKLSFNSDGIANSSNTTINIDFLRFQQTDVTKRYTYKVDAPNTGDDVLDNYFKIFKLYNSLSNVQNTIDSVRRLADSRLQSYGIYDNQTNNKGQKIDPIFYSTEDLYEKSIVDGKLVADKDKPIPRGTRGYVGQNAQGIFKNRDGWFVIYKGSSL